MIVSLHYFHCINAYFDLVKENKVLINVSDPFKKSSFYNRTIIVGSQGEINLSIPVIGGRSVRQKYIDVKIDYQKKWQRNHFLTLCTAYGKSPFF